MIANRIQKNRSARGSRARSLRTSLSVLLVAVCLALSLLGCSDAATAGAARAAPSDQRAVGGEPPASDEPNVGSLSLALDVGGATLSSVTYTIIGGPFVKSGSIDVSNSARISGIIGGIPFGTNYALTLSGASAGPPETNCSGSTTFDISGPGPTPVPVQVTCKQAIIAVTPPPSMPAPVPQLPILALALALLGLGVAVQTRNQPSRSDQR